MNILPIAITSYPDKCNYLENNASRQTFTGHFGTEALVKDGITCVLKKETSFFRDIETKNFVVNYINNHFLNKDKIKMLIGACSSGEEAFTYSMLLKSLADKVSILGFDLSKSSIDSAKSGKILMQHPIKGKKSIEMFSTSLKDAFLCFDTDQAIMNLQEFHNFKLFREFFEITDEIPPKEKFSLSRKLRKILMEKFLRVSLPEFESKIVKLRDGKAKNCKFVEGNILQLPDITKGEKFDVITFSNAMYHITADEFGNGIFRLPKNDSEETITKIAMNVKNSLNKDGIFVLGENEEIQMMDSNTISKVFRKLGFQPLNRTREHEANVWRLL